MTNQISKSTRGRLYTLKLARGGSMDAQIAHALDVLDRVLAIIKLADDADERSVFVSQLRAIVQ